MSICINTIIMAKKENKRDFYERLRNGDWYVDAGERP